MRIIINILLLFLSNSAFGQVYYFDYREDSESLRQELTQIKNLEYSISSDKSDVIINVLYKDGTKNEMRLHLNKIIRVNSEKVKLIVEDNSGIIFKYLFVYGKDLDEYYSECYVYENEKSMEPLEYQFGPSLNVSKCVLDFD